VLHTQHGADDGIEQMILVQVQAEGQGAVARGSTPMRGPCRSQLARHDDMLCTVLESLNCCSKASSPVYTPIESASSDDMRSCCIEEASSLRQGCLQECDRGASQRE
jgi:hypothetical protein